MKKFITYFTLLCSVVLFGQAKPGGTSLNVELWLKADALGATIAADSTVAGWNDQSGLARNFSTVSGAPAPKITKSAMNYNPALVFSVANQKLISATDFVPLTTKSYYVFTVSTQEKETEGTVFRLNGSGAVGNYYGWSATEKARFERASQVYTHTNTSDKPYGISSVITTNTSGPAQGFYQNGTPYTTGFTNGVLTATAGSRMVVGNQLQSTTSQLGHIGEIQEIIVLSGTSGALIPAAELRKVQSYLAVKYGLTLDPATTAQPDYTNSNSTNVWTGASNTGYQNNIFGIGRDDNAGLYQKQSKSYDKSSMTVFLSSLSESNQENTGTFASDRTYLMFGSNAPAAGTDFVSYAYPAGTTFANGSIDEKVNFRLSRVHKAQVTVNGVASSQTVNIRDKGKYVLVSSDPNFPAVSTRVYKINGDGDALNVLVNDGDYITTASFEFAPGGVINGLRVWLKADDCSSVERIAGDTHNVNRWRDQTSSNNHYTFDAVKWAAKTRPTFLPSEIEMNFHPAIKFDYNDYLATLTGRPMSTNNPADFTSYVVYSAKVFANTQVNYLFGFGSPRMTTNPASGTNGTGSPAFGFAPSGGFGRSINNSNPAVAGYGVNGTVQGFFPGTTSLYKIHSHKAVGSAVGSGFLKFDFSGLEDLRVVNNSTWGKTFKLASGSILGGGNLQSGTFNGIMSEVFFYERDLNLTEQSIIRSYLAMKYAITTKSNIATKLALNYVLSDGTNSVWNGAVTPFSLTDYLNDGLGYHHNVAGLVRDDNSGLFNNISRSTGSGAIITMEVEPVGNMCSNQSKSALPNDMSGLFWGHDGRSLDRAVTSNACFDITRKSYKNWLVRKTNLTSQTVKVKPSGGDFPYNGPGWQVYMLIADSAAKLDGDNWDQAVPATYINGEHVVNYTFTDENTYVSFGAIKVEATADCVSCTFTGEKILNFNKTTWTNGQKVRANDLGGLIATITVDDPNNSLRPGYPRASSQKSQRHLKRGSMASNPLPVTTTIALDKAAKATFDIFDIDRTQYRYNEVEVYGMCNGQRINPAVTFVTTAAKSSYTIEGVEAFAKVRPGNVAYTNKNGKMHVEFASPVSQIVMVSKINYARPATGYQTDGFGPIKFTCPMVPPPANEDGLIFTKQGPASVQQCEDIEYTFKITNTNCEDKTVKFEDILPATDSGLKWIAESLSIADDAVETATVNAYEGTQNLTITDLLVKGATTTTFRASARYDIGSTTSGTVYNQGKIDYSALEAGVPTAKSLMSVDSFVNTPYPQLDTNGNPVLDTNGNPVMSTDYRTKTKVTPVANIPEKVTSYVIFDKSCIASNEEVLVSVYLYNPNSFNLTEMMLNVMYSEDFTYVPNSLSSTTVNLTSPVITDLDAGLVAIEGFILPSGTNEITFKIKAPAILSPIVDPDTNQEIATLEVTYDISSETSDVCLANSIEASGEALLKTCGYCTQPPAIGTPEETKLGISVQQKQDGWPEKIPNGWITLESKSKGFVITRVAHVETTSPLVHTGSIELPEEGMIVYDIQDKCVKLFSEDRWNCIERSCNYILAPVGSKPGNNNQEKH